MARKRRSSNASWTDPDDAPELTRGWFAQATPHEAGKPRRGRPPLAAPKKLVSLRIDQDVLEAFQAGGRGWQSRINQELRSLVMTRKRRVPSSPSKPATGRAKSAATAK